LGSPNDAGPAIRPHHERFDGTGYPDRLQGEEIPLGARIIHVADALDSMLTTRIYQVARPLDEALTELRSGATSAARRHRRRRVAASQVARSLLGSPATDVWGPCRQAGHVRSSVLAT